MATLSQDEAFHEVGVGIKGRVVCMSFINGRRWWVRVIRVDSPCHACLGGHLVRRQARLLTRWVWE